MRKRVLSSAYIDAYLLLVLLVISIVALYVLGHEHSHGGHGLQHKHGRRVDHVHSSGHHDGLQLVQPSGQTWKNISRDFLAPGVASFLGEP